MGGMVEHPNPPAGGVPPENLAVGSHLLHRAGSTVVDHQDRAVGEELGIGGIGDAPEVETPDQMAGGVEAVHPAPTDLGHQEAAVGEGRVAIGSGKGGRRSVAPHPWPPQLAEDPAVGGDDEDPLVGDVGHGDRPVGEPIGVVGGVEEPGGRPWPAGMTVAPEHPAGGRVEAEDDVPTLKGGNDGPAIGSKEGIVGAQVRRDGPQVEPIAQQHAGGRGQP